MTLGPLIYYLPSASKALIRSIEKVNKKLIDNKYSLVFNTTCINENLLPKYTNIYIYILIYIYIYISLSSPM